MEKETFCIFIPDDPSPQIEAALLLDGIVPPEKQVGEIGVIQRRVTFIHDLEERP